MDYKLRSFTDERQIDSVIYGSDPGTKRHLSLSKVNSLRSILKIKVID